MADIMKMDVNSELLKEMLTTLESSADHWDVDRPQEAFLAKKGELKYYLHDMEGFARVKEFEGDSENTGKTATGVLKTKNNPSVGLPATQSMHPKHDSLMNTIQELQALQSNTAINHYCVLLICYCWEVGFYQCYF